MSEIFAADLLEWRQVRPEVTSGVYGRTLLDAGVRIVLTRVDPGGGFRPHRDPYGHMFYFLTGEGIIRVEENSAQAAPGLVVQVAPGELHSYENTGSSVLTLLSVNIAAD